MILDWSFISSWGKVPIKVRDEPLIFEKKNGLGRILSTPILLYYFPNDNKNIWSGNGDKWNHA